MKKFLLTIASVLLASMASAQVSVQHQNLDVVVSNPSASQQSQAVKKVAKIAENQRWLGYYNSDNWAGEGLGMGVPSYPGDNQVAIYLTKDILKSYVGMKIVGMRFAICEEIGSTTAFFKKVENDAPGADLRTKELSTTALGWNEVMFSEPVEITGDEEFAAGYTYTQIGDQYNGKAFPFSAVKEGIDNQYLFIYCLDPKTGDTGWKKFTMAGKNMSIQVLVEGEFPEYSAMPEDFGMVTGSINTDAKITVPFVNNSAYAVTDLDYVVSVDGVAGSEEHATFSPSVGVGSKSSFKVSVPCGSVEAKKSIKVEITKVNGHDNESESKVGQGTVGVFSDKYPRNLVIEEFTTEQCPNCPRVAGLLAYYMEHADPTRVWAVCHHSAYYTDWLTQPCDEPLLYLYNDNGMTYAPGLMFNRQPDFDAQYAKGNMDNVLFANTYDDVEGYADYQLTLFSNAQLSMQVAVNDDSSVATVIVSGECNESLDPAQNKLTLYLTEDEIPARDQYGASGDFYHMHVIRYFNSAWGDPVVWENRHFTATYSIPIDEAWNKDKLTLVAFLNKHNAEDRLDNRIENSIGMTFNNAVTALKATETSDNTYEVARYNAAGQRVFGEQKGLNIIKLSDGRTLKVMVR